MDYSIKEFLDDKEILIGDELFSVDKLEKVQSDLLTVLRNHNLTFRAGHYCLIKLKDELENKTNAMKII